MEYGHAETPARELTAICVSLGLHHGRPELHKVSNLHGAFM